MEGVLVLFIGTFGLLGNILSIIIFCRSRGHIRPSSSQTNLLICLATFNSMFLIFAMMTFSVKGLVPDRNSSFFLAFPYLFPLAGTSLTGSVYSVVAIYVEMYGFLRQSHAKIFSTRFLIFFIILFSVSFNLVKFFEMTAEQVNDPDATFHVIIKASALRKDFVFYTAYVLFISFLVKTLIPLVIMTVLNIFILRSVNRMAQSKRDSSTAPLLFSIVIIFLICHFPSVIINVYEGIRLYKGTSGQWPEWVDIILCLNPVFLVINSSLNIIIFTAGDLSFRNAFFQMFQYKKASVTTTNIPLVRMSNEPSIEYIMSEV